MRHSYLVLSLAVGVFIGVLLSVVTVALAGSLDPVDGPGDPNSQMYTLEQIYNRINTRTPQSRMAAFTAPSQGPATGTMHSLNDIYLLLGERAPVPRSGQTTMWAAGDDGAGQRGVGLPAPRFTDNSDGTVTDNLTGLIWLKNASCTVFFAGDPLGTNLRTWLQALEAASLLQDGSCGLTDGSTAGSWRLPNLREMYSLLNFEYNVPALSNSAGNAQHTDNDPFLSVQNNYYWTSTTRASFVSWKYYVNLYDGRVLDEALTAEHYVWLVRGGE